jgi:recombination protein RecA
MAKKKTEGTKVDQDDLAQLIAGDLNKKGYKTYFLNEDTAPVDVNEYISTSDPRLDLIIANKPNGGIASGRITEINGLEGTGKSLLCGHIIAEGIKKGAIPVLMDTENALYQAFFEAIGIDFGKVMYRQPATLEEVFESVDFIISTVVKRGDKRNILIVVDSLSACPTKRELEADYDKDGYATDRAIIIGKAMRKIVNTLGQHNVSLVFTQQLRFKMNAPAFSDPYTTSGGKALPFAATTRLRVTQLGKLTDAEKNVIGVQVRVKTDKNRLGPPHRHVDLDVYFDRGIDSITSMIKSLREYEIIKQNGAYYTYVDQDGVEHQFQTKTWQEFKTKNSDAYAEIYQKLCDKMILTYADKHLSTEDGVSVEPGDID